MSGLCGILRLDGERPSQGDLDRQMSRLSHLGPDRRRTWSAGPIAFGHLLMRTASEDALDAQPLRDRELALVADLRLDNRPELASVLSIDGPTLASMPDSAILLAAWRKWGPDCVEHLVGDFAFAMWDANASTLTLARDHMGQRHVFYHHGPQFIAFASEIKGLWALPQVPRVLQEDRFVKSFLNDNPVEPGATGYEGIRAVPGGTIVTITADGGRRSRRYWEPQAAPAHEGRDEAYYIRTYREVLAEAVACRLRRATTPAGLLMGAGFDSTAICALAGPIVTPQRRKFIAVSSVMPEDYRGTIAHARYWCEICRKHMPHLDMRYITRDGLDIFTGMERGFLAGDAAHSPYRYVTDAIFAELAAAGARIAMDGHGGDYTINPRGQNFLVRLLRTRQFRRFVSEFEAMGRHLDLSFRQNFVRNVLVQLAPASWMRLRTRLNNGLALFGPTIPLSQAVIRSQNTDRRPVRRRRSGDSQRIGMLRALRKVQNTSAQPYSIAGAAHGLEFTQPFHDKRVVEFALAVPEALYVKNGKSRHLARTALKDLYPPEYQDRPNGNDDMGPDFLAMAKRVEPRVLAEIDRMERAGKLSNYFNFPKMRAMLTRRTLEQHASGNEYDTRQAQLAFLAARYIEWFRGENA